MDGFYSKAGVGTVCFYMTLSIKRSIHFCERIIVHGEPLRAGRTNDEFCVGDEDFSRTKTGMVGMSSKTCCTTPRPMPDDPARPCAESSARMTPCTRASCDGASPHVRGADAPPPRSSQMHRRSFPGMIWHSCPVSMWRTSMKRESKMRTYGGCQAMCSAVPSHSMVPLVRLGSACWFTYNPNSVEDSQGTDRGSN
jgi:hypothetical protein